jgi:hypothetical protein
MITETKKAFALAALIVATGVAAVELTRSPAQADPASGTSADARIAAAFELVAEMPPSPPLIVPMAVKGDLQVPFGCSILATDEAECMDVAYEVESEPSVVVETRSGSTSTLTRMDPLTVAGVTGEMQQAE